MRPPMGKDTRTCFAMLCLMPALAAQSIHSSAGKHVQFPNGAFAVRLRPDQMIPTDLTSALQSPPLGQQIVLKAALNAVQSLETAPTCNRLAALDLINGCKDLDGGTAGHTHELDQMLDEMKSEYSARLAVCELLSAKVTVPRQCNSLIPTAHACVKSGYRSLFSREEAPTDRVCYPDMSRAQFDRCLRSLEDRPQSWTSYSNARQNAILMCQASRDAIEKESSLMHFKNLTSIAALLSTALADTEEQSRTWLHEQRDLQRQIRKLQEETAGNLQQKISQSSQDIQHSRQMTLSTFDELQTAIQMFTGIVQGAAETAGHDIDQSVGARMDTAIEHFQHFTAKLRASFADSSAHQADTHSDQLQRSMNIAKAQMQSLFDLAAHDLRSLYTDVGDIRQDLQSSLHSANSHVETVATNVATIINGIESQVGGLGDKVDWIETKINASFLGVESSMNSTIHRVQESFRTIQRIAAFTQAITNARYVLGALSLLGTIIGIYPFSPKLAKAIVGLFSCFVFVRLLIEHIECRKPQDIVQIIRVTWCIAAFILSVRLIYACIFQYCFQTSQHIITLPRIEVAQDTTRRYSRFDRAATAPL